MQGAGREFVSFAVTQSLDRLTVRERRWLPSGGKGGDSDEGICPLWGESCWVYLGVHTFQSFLVMLLWRIALRLSGSAGYTQAGRYRGLTHQLTSTLPSRRSYKPLWAFPYVFIVLKSIRKCQYGNRSSDGVFIHKNLAKCYRTIAETPVGLCPALLADQDPSGPSCRGCPWSTPCASRRACSARWAGPQRAHTG